jgi:hypothetical protein
MNNPIEQNSVLRCDALHLPALTQLLARYGLELVVIAANAPILGSYWGDSEAGLVHNILYVRNDTPIHSALHEACHYICMDSSRRKSLHTDAGGDYAEENGVCYLQILLADALPDVGRARLWADMDAWGYSFRLGATQTWFEQDADDARTWLHAHQLIDNHEQPTWRVRE